MFQTVNPLKWMNFALKWEISTERALSYALQEVRGCSNAGY